MFYLHHANFFYTKIFTKLKCMYHNFKFYTNNNYIYGCDFVLLKKATTLNLLSSYFFNIQQ